MSDADDWAASGAMALTGRRDGAPLRSPGAPATAVRVALQLFAALTRARTGVAPQLPDVTLLSKRAAAYGWHRNAPWSLGGSFRCLRAADGWWGLSLARTDDVALVPALIERPPLDDPWAEVSAWSREQPARTVVDRAQLLGLAAAVVPDQPGVCDDEQSEHRQGLPLIATPGGPRRSAERPRVIDLSSLWAGPLCASLLQAAGADVCKVESSDRPDGARAGNRAFYERLHAGQRSVTLDFTTTDGRRELARLVADADVVIEASRPRALAQLGIDAPELVAAGTTWLSITAYGRTGPWSNRVGYGDDVAAAAGLVVRTDDGPVPCGDAIADPLTGVHAAVAVAAALLDDRAWLLDVSMRDVAAAAARLTGVT
jgi:crotonobetainyl-CoA:carnitine CoA-transferase CaiB-like acyl-CoA transferase